MDDLIPKAVIIPLWIMAISVLVIALLLVYAALNWEFVVDNVVARIVQSVDGELKLMGVK